MSKNWVIHSTGPSFNLILNWQSSISKHVDEFLFDQLRLDQFKIINYRMVQLRTYRHLRTNCHQEFPYTLADFQWADLHSKMDDLQCSHCMHTSLKLNVKCYCYVIIRWAVNNMPNIFKCLEADVLGGRLGSKKLVQAYFTWPKFSEVGKS